MVSSDGCNEVITQFSGPIAHTKSLYFRSSQFVGAVLLPSGLRARNAGRKGGNQRHERSMCDGSALRGCLSQPRGSVWAVRRTAPVSVPMLNSRPQPHRPLTIPVRYFCAQYFYTWVLVPASARHGLVSRRTQPPPPALRMVLGLGHLVGWMDASPPAPEWAMAPVASNGVPDINAACLWSERIARQMSRCDRLSTGCPPVPSCVLCA